MKRFICMLLVCTQLAACSTVSTVPYAEWAGNAHGKSIAVGDQLRVTFREGGEKRIKVTRFSADEICAVDGCIRTTDIASVERVEPNVATGLLIALAVVLAIAALVSAANIGNIGAAMAR